MSQLGLKKSRKGCRRCKDRRVKCDELAPCDNCIRRGEECSLLNGPTASNPDMSQNRALPTNSDEWSDDLELMRHFAVSTSADLFGDRPEPRMLWREYIPQQALKHHFLMHGLLALSALHLVYLRPDQSAKYLQICDKHQEVALREFRSILSTDINPSDADALFALSSVLSLSSMARSCIVNDAQTIDMNAIAEIFFLTRGVRDVIHHLWDNIHAGPMLGIFKNQDVPDGMSALLPEPVAHQFGSVRAMLVKYGLDSEALTHCQTALTAIESLYRSIVYFAPIAPVETAQIFRWTVEVPTGFVRLVRAENPPALVVLTFWVVAFRAIKKAWYMQNFADYALRGIGLALDPAMQHWLEWPRQQMDERLAVLGVRTEFTDRPSPLPLIEY